MVTGGAGPLEPQGRGTWTVLNVGVRLITSEGLAYGPSLNVPSRPIQAGLGGRRRRSRVPYPTLLYPGRAAGRA